MAYNTEQETACVYGDEQSLRKFHAAWNAFWESTTRKLDFSGSGPVERHVDTQCRNGVLTYVCRERRNATKSFRQSPTDLIAEYDHQALDAAMSHMKNCGLIVMSGSPADLNYRIAQLLIKSHEKRERLVAELEDEIKNPRRALRTDFVQQLRDC